MNDGSMNASARLPGRPALAGRLGAIALVAALGATWAATTAAGQDSPAPTVPEIAEEIRKGLGSLEQFHVKCSISSELLSAGDLEEAEIWGLNGERDEYAFSRKKQFRDIRYWERREQPTKHKIWYHRYGSYNGSVMAEMIVEFEAPKEATVLTATLAPRFEETSVNVSNLYLEAIGSPFYDGRHLDVWRRHPDREPKYSFSLPAALTARPYVVRDGYEEVDGAKCRVVELPGQDTLWLDPARGYAVVRRDWHYGIGQPLMFRWQNSGFKPMSRGVWLPTRVQRTLMPFLGKQGAAEGRAIAVTTADVVTVAISGVSDSLFEPNFPPGTPVMDSTRMPPQQDERGREVRDVVTYRIGDNPASTQRHLDAAIAMHRNIAYADSRPWLAIIGANVGVLVVVAGVVAWQRRRKALALAAQEPDLASPAASSRHREASTGARP